jgi:hypothetical protein
LEYVPGTRKVCATCNTKKVQCSYLGVKLLVEVIVSSDEEGPMLRLKKAKTLGVVPKAERFWWRSGSWPTGQLKFSTQSLSTR